MGTEPDDPLGAPIGERDNSRASSRARSHVEETGICTASPSHEPINRAPVGPVPPRMAMDEVFGLGSETLEIASVEYGQPNQLRSGWKTIYPIMVVNRYERQITLPRRDDDYNLTLAPLTLDFSQKDVPGGWTACVHPEGALYFYHPSRKIYTDAYLIDDAVLEQARAFIDALDYYITEHNFRIPSDAELVLELEEENKEISWNYYFVDNSRRTLFWIHEHDVTWLTSGLLGEATLPHFKHEMERYYWMHIEYFPHHHDMNEEMADELINILIHALADQLTSLSSTVPFSLETISKILSIAKEIKASPSNPESVSIHGRLMSAFVHPRFINYHGQRGARLNRDQSVHVHEVKRWLLLVTVLAPILFNAPHVHLRTLEKIWIDEIMGIRPWEEFITKLWKEWQDYILLATVLLAANVGFLAIPSVDLEPAIRTPAQVASYISVAYSIGSIITGLLLVRQFLHGSSPRQSVEVVASFLVSKEVSERGVETLAIVFSVPYALLMWGMLAFLLAFSLECFKVKQPAALSIPATMWFLVGLLVIWTVATVWDTGEGFIVHRIKRKVQEVYSLLHVKDHIDRVRRVLVRSTDTDIPLSEEEPPTNV